MRFFNWPVISNRMLVSRALGLALGFVILPGMLFGGDSAAPDTDKEMMKALLHRVEQLEARVAQLEAQQKPGVQVQSSPPAASAPSPAAAESTPQQAPGFTMMPERMEARTLMQIRGFGDMTLHGSNARDTHTAFSLGQLDLFVTSDVSEKFRLLSEIVFEADPQNAFGVDVERLLLQYSLNDYFNLAVGRYHTDIGFYNTAYHHSAWLQRTIGRPFLFEFEDKGGILPIHNVGASLSGQIPSGSLGLHYVAEVGNGRASSSPFAEPVQNEVDENNGKAVNLALYARPNIVHGLQVGFSAYHDNLHPRGITNIAESIFDAYAVLQRRNFEWLNEALLIRHAVKGGHIFDTPGFYTQLSKAFGRYRPYFRYQYVNESPQEPTFPFVGLQHGPSVGLRYDASEAVALKVQYDRDMFREQPSVNGLALQFAFTF